MGGALNIGYDSKPTSVPEYNIQSDPISARAVLTSGVPITMIGLDATTAGLGTSKAAIRAWHFGYRCIGRADESCTASPIRTPLCIWQRDDIFTCSPLTNAYEQYCNAITQQSVRSNLDRHLAYVSCSLAATLADLHIVVGGWQAPALIC
jgi:hypothetical protein